MKIPDTPFSTRLSGSAKETELRLRSIFQWKKKRPPIVLIFLLAVILLTACGELVDFNSTEPEPTVSDIAADAPGDVSEDPPQSPSSPVGDEPEINGNALFDSYVTEFPFYVYTGMKLSDHDGHVFTIEDTPKNLAEAAVIEWYGLNWTGGTKKLELCCGNEALRFGSESDYKQYTIHEVSTLTPEDFTVETMPFLDAFIRWLSQDIQKFGLTEYTVVYADQSWEWTPEQLALGPQLGNGRYERLYLLGKTETSNAWKLYECYWGEYVFGRIIEEPTPAEPEQTADTQAVLDFVDAMFAEGDVDFWAFLFPGTGPIAATMDEYHQQVRAVFAQYEWTLETGKEPERVWSHDDWTMYLSNKTCRIAENTSSNWVNFAGHTAEGSTNVNYSYNGEPGSLSNSLLELFAGPSFRLARVYIPIEGQDNQTLMETYEARFRELYLNSGAISDYKLLELSPIEVETTTPFFLFSFSVKPTDLKSIGWENIAVKDDGWVDFSFEVSLGQGGYENDSAWMCGFWQLPGKRD